MIIPLSMYENVLDQLLWERDRAPSSFSSINLESSSSNLTSSSSLILHTQDPPHGTLQQHDTMSIQHLEEALQNMKLKMQNYGGCEHAGSLSQRLSIPPPTMELPPDSHPSLSADDEDNQKPFIIVEEPQRKLQCLRFF